MPAKVPSESMVYEGEQHEVELGQEAVKAAECFKQLRDEQRSVLEMTVYENFTHEKVASLLGVPLGSVKSLARQGLIQMRDCMSRSSIRKFGGDAS